MDIQKQISLAKIEIMRKPETCFLAQVCCQLTTVIDDSISTACTDGKCIKINPTFWNTLNQSEQVFLIAHETLHVVYRHMLRREHRDPTVFNIAGDYVINMDLKDQGFTLIKEALYDKKYKDMSTEQVYNLLIQENNPANASFEGDVEYTTGGIEKTEQEIKDIIIKASQITKMQKQAGSIPKSIQRYLDELVKPKINWRIVLRRFMQQLDNQDYTWKRPNKRYLSQNLYLPSLYSKGLSKLTFALDTSGSISAKEFNHFLSEVYAVMRSCKPKQIELLQFDHKLQGKDIINSVYDLSKVTLKGHGGTRPNVAIEAFNTSDSKALIVITDGHFKVHHLVPTKRPVIWAVFDNPTFTCPYGHVIHIEI